MCNRNDASQFRNVGFTVITNHYNFLSACGNHIRYTFFVMQMNIKFVQFDGTYATPLYIDVICFPAAIFLTRTFSMTMVFMPPFWQAELNVSSPFKFWYFSKVSRLLATWHIHKLSRNHLLFNSSQDAIAWIRTVRCWH